MEPQKIRTLKILEAVENGETPSQRDLARQLNISLGLVNSFVKRLVNKGYFKITTIPRNRVKYILTPKGAAEKTRLTYEYITFSLEFYRSARRKMQVLLKEFQKLKIRRIAFYGVSDLAEIGYLYLQETEMTLTLICDDRRIGNRFLGGHRIRSIEELRSEDFDRVIVTSIEDAEPDYERILKLGIAADKIIKAVE